MEQKQVLLVEDEKNIRELYAMALINAGIDILMAEDGEQGVALALKHHPSLILMDISMPVLDGHEAVKKIRADSWGKNAKIIFLTNHSEATNVAHAISQHPEDYIVKVNTPVKEIINRVREAMY
ncbi:MAG TPA: response regulator [Candidatus Paceibacterota bacterium]|nr:response regulator [Candidatus Paceibacterota bacterium]HMO82893.1 response regulator [Candidatus Paceibacterota bacterium]